MAKLKEQVLSDQGVWFMALSVRILSDQAAAKVLYDHSFEMVSYHDACCWLFLTSAKCSCSTVKAAK